MKLKVTYRAELCSKLSFPDLNQATDNPAFQKVIGKWEAKGITLDQGGDDDWYEIDACDPISDSDVAKLLQELERTIK